MTFYKGEPVTDARLAGQLAQEYLKQAEAYVAFSTALQTLVENVLKATPYGIDTVSGRAKAVDKLQEKIIRKGYVRLDQVTDRCGVRIVCYYSSEVEDIATVIRQEFEVLEDSLHGGSEPDSFGYTSRHLLVRLSSSRLVLPEWEQFETLTAEIQIRSVLQHAWAAISHALAYKSEEEVPNRTRRRLARVAALLESGDEIFDVYREEVLQLRQEYKEAALGPNWEELPLDLDAVVAAWRQLRFKELADAAAASGWKDPVVAGLYNSAEHPPGNLDRASRLTRVALAGGLTSIRDLRQSSEEAARDHQWLRELYLKAAPQYAPFAIAPDVLGLYLISRFGESLRHVAVGGRYPYLEVLVNAALEEQTLSNQAVNEKETGMVVRTRLLPDRRPAEG